MYESNGDKNITPNRSYIINNKPKDEDKKTKIKYSIDFGIDNNTNVIKKSKSFSLNKSRINTLDLKYGILNYDISYHAETFRMAISEIDKKRIKNIYSNMKFSLIRNNNKIGSSGTEKENPMLIEDNYLKKYNTLKAFFV